MTKTGICVAIAVGLSIGVGFHATAWADDEVAGSFMLAQADQSGADAKKESTPEERMNARFPQPVKVGHLIGLPVLDGGDSTIGYVQQVVRTSDGKIKLIVPYGEWFGWARDGGWLSKGRRPVAVPIETVALLALQINAVDMDRDAFARAPTWSSAQAEPIRSDETIKIALGRR